MLSILVPIYNYNARQLVSALKRELEPSSFLYEILCYDDASTETFRDNEKLGDFSNVHYRLLDKNIGRSRIRNLMASNAKYEWLLFLDADVVPVDERFVNRYLDCIAKGQKVVCGGIRYCKEDATGNNSLRYLYGSQVEEKTAEARAKNPYKWFSTANVLISKSVFSSVRFFEELQTYGMEDTLFAVQLKENGIAVKHIDNPVWHKGLEDNGVYLDKTIEAIENLYFLYQKSLISPADSGLLRRVLQLQKWKSARIFNQLFRLAQNPIKKNLLSDKPKLFLFNCYRLGILNALFSS